MSDADERARLRAQVEKIKPNHPRDWECWQSTFNVGAIARLLDDVERAEAGAGFNAREFVEIAELRARAERLEAALRGVEITISVVKGSLGEHTEARGMLEGQITKIRAALADPAPGGQDAEREGGA